MKKYLKYVYSMLLTAMLSGPLCAAGTTCDAGLSSYLIADTSIDQKWEARKKALDARQQQAVSTMDARWLVSEKAFQEKWKKKRAGD